MPECIKPYCRVGDNLDVASRYRILVTTCVSAGVLYGQGIRAGHFTHVFVDEVRNSSCNFNSVPVNSYVHLSQDM